MSDHEHESKTAARLRMFGREAGSVAGRPDGRIVHLRTELSLHERVNVYDEFPPYGQEPAPSIRHAITLSPAGARELGRLLLAAADRIERVRRPGEAPASFQALAEAGVAGEGTARPAGAGEGGR